MPHTLTDGLHASFWFFFFFGFVMNIKFKGMGYNSEGNVTLAWLG